MNELQTPEFSRPISVARLGGDPATYRITATPAEAAALAARFGLPALRDLEAEVFLRRLPGGDVAFAAEFRAMVTQICIVTLAAFEAELKDAFTLLYRPGIDDDEADRIALEAIEDEIVEPLVGDIIDIGEAVAQQLSLVLDPYPRAPGQTVEVLDGPWDNDPAAAASEPENPFAALRGLLKS